MYIYMYIYIYICIYIYAWEMFMGVLRRHSTPNGFVPLPLHPPRASSTVRSASTGAGAAAPPLPVVYEPPLVSVGHATGEGNVCL